MILGSILTLILNFCITKASHLNNYAVAFLQVGNPQLTIIHKSDVTVGKGDGRRIVFVVDTQHVGVCKEHQTFGFMKHVGIIAFHVVNTFEDGLFTFLNVSVSFYPVGSQSAIGLVNLIIKLRAGVTVLSYFVDVGEEVPFLHLLTIRISCGISVHHAQGIIVGVSAHHRLFS